MKLRELLQTHLMDLVGTHGGRGRSLERPAIIFVAMRPRPHTGDICGGCALGIELGDLALKRWSDLAGDDLASTRFPVAGNALRPGAPDERFDDASALCRALDRDSHLAERL